jgi:membrane-bound lytic murein transglycosylase D
MRTASILPVVFGTLLIAACTLLDTTPNRPAIQKEAGAAAAAVLQDHAAPAAGTANRVHPDPQTPAKIPAEDDFWQRVRNGFRLSGARQKSVIKRIEIYSNNTRQVERVLQRGEPYLAYIQNEVERRGFPAEITLLPFVESGFDPFAYSHGRAAGLWQFIPGTGKRYGLQQDWWFDGRRDVVASTRAALDYLERLQRQFDGDWLLALAAYNSGEGTVLQAIRRNRKAGRPTDFWNLDLPRETAAYVPKLLAICAVVKHPEKYGVRLIPVDAMPAFVVVDTRSQLDIAVAADLAGMDIEELYRLNPGYNRWATHPDGPHRLAIPAGKSGLFRENLANLPEAQRVKWVRHKIRSGETLSHIAAHYNTTVRVLRSTNELQNTNIRAGSHLLIPVAAKDPARYAALKKQLQTGHPSGSRITYKVQHGDSLWDIARKHKVTVNQVTRWNRLDSGALIKPGQKLVIWQGGTGRNKGKRIRSVFYTVRNGDTLYEISRKFNVTIRELRQWNDLPKGKYLQPGQSLKLYVDVTRLTQHGRG